MNKKTKMATGAVSIALAMAVVGAVTGSVIAQTPAPAPTPVTTYNAPDNPDNNGNSNTADVASNVSGTTDKTLRLTPTHDKSFTVEVVNAEGEVVDEVEFSDGHTPPVVVGPGHKARIRDNNDQDSTRPKGTSTFN